MEKNHQNSLIPLGEKLAPENKKNITKKKLKSDAKSLNDARAAKRN